MFSPPETGGRATRRDAGNEVRGPDSAACRICADGRVLAQEWTLLEGCPGSELERASFSTPYGWGGRGCWRRHNSGGRYSPRCLSWRPVQRVDSLGWSSHRDSPCGHGAGPESSSHRPRSRVRTDEPCDGPPAVRWWAAAAVPAAAPAVPAAAPAVCRWTAPAVSAAAPAVCRWSAPAVCRWAAPAVRRPAPGCCSSHAATGRCLSYGQYFTLSTPLSQVHHVRTARCNQD